MSAVKNNSLINIMTLIQQNYLLRQPPTAWTFIANILKFPFTGSYWFIWRFSISLNSIFLKNIMLLLFFQNQQHIEESQTGWAGGVGFLLVFYFNSVRRYSFLHLAISVLKHEAAFWGIQHYYLDLLHCRTEAFNAVLDEVSGYLLSKFKNLFLSWPTA